MAWRLLAALAVVVLGSAALDAAGASMDDLSWPADVLAQGLVIVPAGILVVPELERRINRRRGRPTA